jgi:hypothetical protein
LAPKLGLGLFEAISAMNMQTIGFPLATLTALRLKPTVPRRPSLNTEHIKAKRMKVLEIELASHTPKRLLLMH